MFKTGAVNIDGDEKNNVQLTKIKIKKHFNKIMKNIFSILTRLTLFWFITS